MMNGLFRRSLRGFLKVIRRGWHSAKKDHPAIYLMMCIGLVTYVIVLALSLYNGSAWIEESGWRGFIQKPNWFLYFLFFPLLGLFTVSNWKSFENAWRLLPAKGVLQEMDLSGTQPLSPNGIQTIMDHLYRSRRRWIWVALVAGLVLTMVESTCIVTFHCPPLYNWLPAYFKKECACKREVSPSKFGCRECKASECTGNGHEVKRVAKDECAREIEGNGNESHYACRECKASECTGSGHEVKLVVEKNFKIFHLDLKKEECNENKKDNVKLCDLPGAKAAGYILVIVVYLMQGLLIAIGFILLFQIFVHLYLFSFLALFPFRHADALGIKLNFKDKMGEFGLADWNNAMNYTNFIIAVVMLLPVISAMSKSEAHDDVGKILFMLFLPLLLFIPILWSFITRVVLQLRLKRNFEQLSASEKDSYKEQVLWPFARDMLSKVTTAIIVIEYFYVASVESGLLENVKSVLGILT